jgi:hypothetical protein
MDTDHSYYISTVRGIPGRNGVPTAKCASGHAVLELPRRRRFKNTVLWSCRAGGRSKTPCFGVAAPAAVQKHRVLQQPRRWVFQNTVFCSSRAGDGSRTRCFEAKKNCGVPLRRSLAVIWPSECSDNPVLRRKRGWNFLHGKLRTRTQVCPGGDGALRHPGPRRAGGRSHTWLRSVGSFVPRLCGAGLPQRGNPTSAGVPSRTVRSLS